ncbi:MAG: hypothetical protein ACI9NQ_001777 [Paracoccaceae bacterium]|jgi:hypothetical protein
MKSRKYSFDWLFFATSVIFFIFGKFISPRYESMLLTSGVVEEVTPISKYCLVVSALLFLCLVGRWIYRWKNRAKK